MKLSHAGQPSHRLDIKVVERVTRVEAHAQSTDRLPGGLNFLQFGDDRRALRVAPLGMKRMRVGAGVYLANRSADALRGVDLLRICVDEDRDHDAAAGKS